MGVEPEKALTSRGIGKEVCSFFGHAGYIPHVSLTKPLHSVRFLDKSHKTAAFFTFFGQKLTLFGKKVFYDKTV